MNKKLSFLQIVCIIGVLFTSFAFVQCGSKGTSTSDKKEAEKDSIVNEEIRKIADGYNKQCPVKIDDITRLDNCTVLPGRVFLYNYTISKEDEFELKKSGQEGIDNIKNMIRSTPALAVLRQHEVTFRYLYKDKAGRVIYSFDIVPEDYK